MLGHEGASRKGFEIALEGACAVFVGEGDGDSELPGCVLARGWDAATAVGIETLAELGRDLN